MRIMQCLVLRNNLFSCTPAQISQLQRLQAQDPISRSRDEEGRARYGIYACIRLYSAIHLGHLRLSVASA